MNLKVGKLGMKHIEGEWDECKDSVRDDLLQHQIIIFKNQPYNPLHFHKNIAKLGGLSNWEQLWFDLEGNFIGKPTEYLDPFTWDKDPMTFPIQRVSGKKVNNVESGIFPKKRLDWHSNLNGPTRADGVGLFGAEPVPGACTIFLNSVPAWKEMPLELKERCLGVYGNYVYSPEIWAGGAWHDVDTKAGQEWWKGIQVNKQNDSDDGSGSYKLKLLWKNEAGVSGFYFNPLNKCELSDPDLYQDLHDHYFQEKYMYKHYWEKGDVVLMDQLLTLHKRGDVNVDDEQHSKRVLWRTTFRLSNKNNFVVNNNRI
jgi:alpha-ketoglutarate-dependent taurine dioxygenase